MKIYLAGGMEFAGENGKQWREIATRELESSGHKVFNPYTSENSILHRHGFSTHQEFHHAKVANVDTFDDYIRGMTEIIDYDLAELSNSDVVLAWLDESCIGGAAGELTLARYLDIPILPVLAQPVNLEKIPGWCLAASGKPCYYQLEHAIRIINEMQRTQC